MINDYKNYEIKRFFEDTTKMDIYSITQIYGKAIVVLNDGKQIYTVTLTDDDITCTPKMEDFDRIKNEWLYFLEVNEKHLN